MLNEKLETENQSKWLNSSEASYNWICFFFYTILYIYPLNSMVSCPTKANCWLNWCVRLFGNFKQNWKYCTWIRIHSFINEKLFVYWSSDRNCLIKRFIKQNKYFAFYVLYLQCQKNNVKPKIYNKKLYVFYIVLVIFLIQVYQNQKLKSHMTSRRYWCCLVNQFGQTINEIKYIYTFLERQFE